MIEDNITHRVSSPQMPLPRQEPAGSASGRATQGTVQPCDHATLMFLFFPPPPICGVTLDKSFHTPCSQSGFFSV